LQLSPEEMLSHHAAGHVCWDDNDVMDDKPTGAVRASFGYMSSFDDVALLMTFIRKFFVDSDASSAAAAGEVQWKAAGGVLQAAGHAVSPAAAADSDNASANVAQPQLLAGSAASAASNTPSTDGCCDVADSLAAAAAAATGRLSAIYLYPIKSCAPQAVTSWPLGPNGLLYDREWALIGPDGSAITQKQQPGLTQVQPEVDLNAGVMRVTAAGVQQQLLVPLQQQQQQQVGSLQPGNSWQQQRGSEQLVRVCGDTVCTHVVASTVAAAKHPAAGKAAAAAAAAVGGAVTYDAAAWFTAVLGAPCKLVQQLNSSRLVKQQNGKHSQQRDEGDSASPNSSEMRRNSSSSSSSSSSQFQERSPGQTLGFANEGQYLLVNQASVEAVAGQLAAAAADSSSSSSNVGQLDALRFRPNLVAEGFEPWAEDSWSSIAVGGSSSSSHDKTSTAAAAAAAAGYGDASAGAAVLDVVGACGRCDMVHIDQATGQRQGGQLLSLLARQRRQRGKLNFGLLLAHQALDAAAVVSGQALEAAAAGGPEHQGVQWLHVGDVVAPTLVPGAVTH
jgi:molybdenum cofactor sulfurtransferase